jgi:cyclopropane fatty-acyl-phospholipid synthase-like methyltransferase
MGFSARHYLAYCEAAFEAGDINLVQYTLAKPAAHSI